MFQNFFTILSVASSATQAFLNFQQGQAMKAYYDSQADIAQLQYEAKKVEAKEQGVRALKEANRAAAAIVAKGAAGGVLSSSGSVLLNQTVSLAEGIRDLNTAKFNENILNNLSAAQYNNFKQAGDNSAAGGVLTALSGFGTSLYSTFEAGGFSGPSKTKDPYGFDPEDRDMG